MIITANQFKPVGRSLLQITLVKELLSFTDLHVNIIRLADKYGAIYRFWLGSELYIVLQNSDYVQVCEIHNH